MNRRKHLTLLSMIVALALLLSGCGLLGKASPSADTERGLTVYFIDVNVKSWLM